MFKGYKKLYKSKYFLTTFLLLLLSLLLAYTTFYFYQKYTHKINQLDLANLTISSLEEQIKILRTEQLPSKNFDQIDIGDTSGMETKTVPAYNLTYKCPPKWQCDNEYGYIVMEGPIEYGSMSVTIKRLENKEFKHARFSTLSTWFEALYNRDPKALDRGSEYGNWPFYAYYEYKNMTEGVLNENRYVLFTQTSASNTEILIERKPYVYTITSYPNGRHTQQILKAIVSSIQFD